MKGMAHHPRLKSPRRYGVLLALLLSISTLHGATGQEPATGQSKATAADPTLEVVLLGTGIPIPNPERATASTLVVAGDRTFMVDTGRGSFMRLVQAGYNQITGALFTHFHSDHIADFGEIMVGRTIAGAKAPLPVLGPAGTGEVVAGFLDAYALDTGYRVAHHGDHFPRDGMKADVREYEPGVIYDEDGLRITMFEVDHDPIKPAVGYRFDWNGSSVVISGDTKKSANLIEAARGCDILVHEAMNELPLNAIRRGMQRNNPRTAAMLGDAMEHHTPTLEVAEVAKEVGAGKLVLTHLFPSIAPNERNESAFIRGMSEIYDGPILVGRDLMRVTP